ncbi:MAG: hypothetical protein KC800_00250 [Candidatus Eremiobacteraeota bacterium]|nr:hypothetical protein [Candidatus Eremiobacteraeota bacterium]
MRRQNQDERGALLIEAALATSLIVVLIMTIFDSNLLTLKSAALYDRKAQARDVLNSEISDITADVKASVAKNGTTKNVSVEGFDFQVRSNIQASDDEKEFRIMVNVKWTLDNNEKTISRELITSLEGST